jgi:hypothetical protein
MAQKATRRYDYMVIYPNSVLAYMSADRHFEFASATWPVG